MYSNLEVNMNFVRNNVHHETQQMGVYYKKHLINNWNIMYNLFCERAILYIHVFVKKRQRMRQEKTSTFNKNGYPMRIHSKVGHCLSFDSNVSLFF